MFLSGEPISPADDDGFWTRDDTAIDAHNKTSGQGSFFSGSNDEPQRGLTITKHLLLLVHLQKNVVA